MTEEELKKLGEAGKIEEVKDPTQAGNVPIAVPPVAEQPGSMLNLTEYLSVLENIKVIHRHLTAAPTFVPQNLAEQIQFYDDGVNYRLYLYINGVWRYVILT